jgi:hypothetical protein
MSRIDERGFLIENCKHCGVELTGDMVRLSEPRFDMERQAVGCDVICTGCGNVHEFLY